MGRSQRHKARVQGVASYQGRNNRKPKITAVPTVAGTNTVGQILTGTNATYTPATGGTVTRQWTRNGVPIAGQSGATYTLVAGDSGKTIRFVNIVRNRFGTSQFVSAPRTIA